MSINSASTTLSPSASPLAKEEEEAGRERMVREYKDRVASLPKRQCWNTTLYNYQGFWYNSTLGCCVEGVMASQDHFQPNPTDIILATNPKCGTTWLKALAFAIVTRNKYKIDSKHPLHVHNPHKYSPFIEIQLVCRENPVPDDTEITDPQLFSTHMPYSSLPGSISRLRCRIVYIWRDPKDAFISRWFFMKNLEYLYPGKTMAFKEVFELFCKGISPEGSYWDHVLGYHKASLENPDRVFLLKYEDMKKDTVSNVKRLAEFLGRPFTAEEEAEGVVRGIIELCSFEKMKSLEVNKTGVHHKVYRNEHFFREGKVGDYANHLTSEMIESIDKITEEKFRGYDLLLRSSFEGAVGQEPA